MAQPSAVLDQWLLGGGPEVTPLGADAYQVAGLLCDLSSECGAGVRFVRKKALTLTCRTAAHVSPETLASPRAHRLRETPLPVLVLHARGSLLASQSRRCRRRV
jgi:hypothetical protein